jgi:hypothetical protein
MKEPTMLTVRAMAGAALMAAATVLALAAAPPAGATVCDPAINGTFTAFSDGQWARTRDSYHDEDSVTATWTFTTTCTDYLDCTGHVTSSQGWTADVVCSDGLWKVRHQVDNWQPCWDGTAAPGQQTYGFTVDIVDPTNYVGWDKTVGPSGACGKNQWLTIDMPFRLTRAG